MEWIEELAGEEGKRFLPVLDMIEQAADDPEWLERVSVLGLSCGTGKSSAISLMIAKTVHEAKTWESGDGLLIVSDTKDALKRYLNPEHMPKVKMYLQQSMGLISRLDEDTWPDEKYRFRQCPVLLMTYARYFSSDKSYIKGSYLRWGSGLRRTRIIMDEEPPILEFITTGNSEVAEVDSGIRNGLVTRTAEERIWCLEAWEKIRDRFHEIVEGKGINLFGDRKEELFFYRPEEKVMPDVDFQRFVADVWNSQETILAKDPDALVLLEEMIRIVSTGAYGSAWKRQDGTINTGLYGVRNNGNLMKDLGAKVIVLDGTADISTAYDHDYIHKVPCDTVNIRKFPELTIRLVNLNTSKSAFADRQDEILKTVREYLESQGEDLQNVTVFTYINQPEKGFLREKRYDIVEHFRNIRGRNDLSDSRRVAQAGLYRKPPIMYTLECFALNEEKGDIENSLNAAVKELPPEQIHDFLLLMTDEAKEPDDLMIREAMTDFEQNVFRTAIRSPENTEPVVYYLFADTHIFSRLVRLIRERFGEKYGSRVEEPNQILEMIKGIRSKECSAHRLIDWLSEKTFGEIFSKKEMLEQSSLTNVQFVSVKNDHPMIADWFREMNEALPPDGLRKGYYMMTAQIEEYLR